MPISILAPIGLWGLTFVGSGYLIFLSPWARSCFLATEKTLNMTLGSLFSAITLFAAMCLLVITYIVFVLWSYYKLIYKPFWAETDMG